MTEKTWLCKTCKHWERADMVKAGGAAIVQKNPLAVGICRRHPPKMMLFPGMQGVQMKSVWTQTRDKDRCGEWSLGE